MQYVFIGIGALVVILIAIVLIRTLRFTPKAGAKVDDTPVEFDKDQAVSNLQKLVQCKTVSAYSHDLEDDAEFEKLIALLPELYPEVYKVCSLTRMDDRALLFKWEGKKHDAPSVLMAHYDVVPVNEEAWEKPPFEGIIEDGVLWGRGTLDTKVTFNGALTAANHLIAKGFVPENDIYLAFSGGEEVNGKGAVHIVDYFKENKIELAMVVDEGGAVVNDVFPGVKESCGLIGICEKGLLDVSFTNKSAGGHASAPKPHTPVGILAKACTKVEANPFPFHITKPVAEMFDTLGRHSTFVYRMIFANLWLFKGVLNGICKKSGGEMNALMRTTVAFTRMSGSKASNVIPPVAEMVANIRINPMDNMDSVIEYLNKTIGDETVEVAKIQGMNPSRISRTDVPGWEKISSAVASTWKGCIVAPYMMVQCSDSRHYSDISDRVYRFSAQYMTKEERASIHGNNEKIRLESIAKATEFYIRLIGMC